MGSSILYYVEPSVQFYPHMVYGRCTQKPLGTMEFFRFHYENRKLSIRRVAVVIFTLFFFFFVYYEFPVCAKTIYYYILCVYTPRQLKIYRQKYSLVIVMLRLFQHCSSIENNENN